MATLRVCAFDGVPFEARQGNARFCSAKCRQSALRARQAGRPDGETVTPIRPPDGVLSCFEASRRELEAAGRLSTSMAAAALKLALRIDEATAVMGFAALVKEHRTAMAEAVRDAAHEADTLEQIQASASAALRLINGDRRSS